jgi:SpoIID/LytB domain protein
VAPLLLASLLALAGPASPVAEPPPAALAQGALSVDSGAVPGPDDPVTLLYGRRLAFSGGVPLVTVRIVEGRRAFTFLPRGVLTVVGRGPGGAVQAPAGGRFTVRVAKSAPGRSVARVLVGERLFADEAGAEAEAELFRGRGYRVSLLTVGTVYGIAGRTVDTRRVLVLVEADGTEAGAARLAAELSRTWGLRAEVHRELVERGRGTVELVAPSGVVLARSPDALSLEIAGDAGALVERVEHSMGYASHGFEDRRYRGRILAAVDAKGLLAAVNLVPLEELARGIVPSEIFASAHPEALKAQAVTARGEILAKIGARHVGDPYVLCAEQHCQVFRGASGEDARTSRAVAATRGEALFAEGGGALVPSYYSANCGGYGEHNDAVWGGPPDASLRGRPDFPRTEATARFESGIDEPLLRSWLATDVPAYCRTASASRPEKYRWVRAFTQAEVDELTAGLGLGAVRALVVEERGVSGRARTLLVKGAKGEARVHSELAIRRLFRMLESGMFVVDAEGSGRARRWVFRGGGWGHGAGMCQTGAIGRAEQGADYREILRHYFSGAETVRMYE